MGAPSRSVFGACRILLARKSMACFSFTSFLASASFLLSSLTATPVFVGALSLGVLALFWVKIISKWWST